MLKKPCEICGTIITVHCTREQLMRWMGGTKIQDAMPDVPRAEREMLLSGICGTCWQDFAEGVN